MNHRPTSIRTEDPAIHGFALHDLGIIKRQVDRGFRLFCRRRGLLVDDLNFSERLHADAVEAVTQRDRRRRA